MANNVAIVTAAGSGMGADAARRLAADGFQIAILSSSGKGEALASTLGGIGVTGSNASNDDLKRLVDATLERWGRIDAVVNSAGHGPRGNITEITDEQWKTGIDTYFLNVVRIARLVAPVMKNQRSGVIINISSYASIEPSPMFPTSSVMRAALRSYTKLFSQTYAADNVRMNNVLPGFVNSLELDPELTKFIPMKRFADVSEISAVISFLVSNDAAYITGQDIVIDGGMTRSI